MYDVDTPHVLYAHAADELGNEEAPNSIAGRAAAAASDLSGSDERADRDVERLAYASSSPSEPIMTETMNALKSSPFLSHYLSTLDSLMPSGFTFPSRSGLQGSEEEKEVRSCEREGLKDMSF